MESLKTNPKPKTPFFFHVDPITAGLGGTGKANPLPTRVALQKKSERKKQRDKNNQNETSKKPKTKSNQKETHTHKKTQTPQKAKQK